MKKLPKVLYEKRFELRQRRCRGRVAIYEQWSIERGTLDAFEVIIAKKTGKDIVSPYPTTADWGELGWTFMKITHAEESFKKLCDKKLDF